MYGLSTSGLVSDGVAEQAGKAIKRSSSMVLGPGIFILDLSYKVITLARLSGGASFLIEYQIALENQGFQVHFEIRYSAMAM